MWLTNKEKDLKFEAAGLTEEHLKILSREETKWLSQEIEEFEERLNRLAEEVSKALDKKIPGTCNSEHVIIKSSCKTTEKREKDREHTKHNYSPKAKENIGSSILSINLHPCSSIINLLQTDETAEAVVVDDDFPFGILKTGLNNNTCKAQNLKLSGSKAKRKTKKAKPCKYVCVKKSKSKQSNKTQGCKYHKHKPILYTQQYLKQPYKEKQDDIQGKPLPQPLNHRNVHQNQRPLLYIEPMDIISDSSDTPDILKIPFNNRSFEENLYDEPIKINAPVQQIAPIGAKPHPNVGRNQFIDQAKTPIPLSMGGIKDNVQNIPLLNHQNLFPHRESINMTSGSLHLGNNNNNVIQQRPYAKFEPISLNTFDPADCCNSVVPNNFAWEMDDNAINSCLCRFKDSVAPNYVGKYKKLNTMRESSNEWSSSSFSLSLSPVEGVVASFTNLSTKKDPMEEHRLHFMEKPVRDRNIKDNFGSTLDIINKIGLIRKKLSEGSKIMLNMDTLCKHKNFVGNPKTHREKRREMKASPVKVIRATNTKKTILKEPKRDFKCIIFNYKMFVFIFALIILLYYD